MNKLKTLSIRSATALSTFVVAPASVLAADSQIQTGIKAATPDGQSNTTDIQQIVRNVVNVLLWVVGIASVIMLIVGGIRYVVSAGDQNAVQGAKNTILYAIVGLVVAFLAFALINFVIEGLLGNGSSSALPTSP
jgi:hypothetical protein